MATTSFILLKLFRTLLINIIKQGVKQKQKFVYLMEKYYFCMAKSG